MHLANTYTVTVSQGCLVFLGRGDRFSKEMYSIMAELMTKVSNGKEKYYTRPEESKVTVIVDIEDPNNYLSELKKRGYYVDRY